VVLWPFRLSTLLDRQGWNCLDELRWRFADVAATLLAAGKSCIRAREKLERREKDGTRDFDIMGPVAG
jgi:hypothetical protein